MITPKPIPTLSWLELSLEIVNTAVQPNTTESILAVWESLFKGCWINIHPTLGQQAQAIFRPEPSPQWSIRLGGRYRASWLVFQVPEHQAPFIVNALTHHFQQAVRNFLLVSPPISTLKSFEFTSFTPPNSPDCSLDFFTPLPFKSMAGKRHFIEAPLFWTLIARRVDRLFSYQPPLPTLWPVLLPHGWHRQTLTHRAQSQDRSLQPIEGCVGPLIFREHWQPLYPWLWLASHIGVGGQLSFGRGHCQIHLPAQPLLAEVLSTKNLSAAIDQVLERHDEAALELAALSHIPFDRAAVVSDYQQRTDANWQPPAHVAFTIEKNGPPLNQTRLIERVPIPSLVLHYALLHILAPISERMFENVSYGYRPGRNRQQVAQAIEEAIAEGYAWVLESDVDDFFPSIDHARLQKALESHFPAADQPYINLLMKLVRSGYILDGQPYERQQGLSQGSPLSPLLANLMLDRFDEQLMQGQTHRMVRYADDFVVLCRSREQAESILDEVANTLHSLGLTPKASKTAIHPVAEGFMFLGMTFGPHHHPSAATLIPPPHKPLYITEPGVFLGLNGESIEIRQEGKIQLRRPIARLSEIILLAPVGLSSMLLSRLQQQGISLTLGSTDGRHSGTVAPDTRQFFAIGHRQAQFYEKLSASTRLNIARGITICKVRNQIALLHQRYSSGDGKLLTTLHTLIRHIKQAKQLSSIRGYEGQAARLYFQRLTQAITHEDFKWVKRLKGHGQDDAPDRINSLLNFSYFLLFSRINTALRSLGLNPYLGFLHESGERFETLSADIQELFRPHVDRWVVKLINRRTIQAEHFNLQGERGQRLTREGCKLVVLSFEGLLQQKPKHQGMTLADAISAQTLSFKNWLCHQGHLALFQWSSAHNDDE